MIEVQVRTGAGGEDSRLLAKDLMDIYTKVSTKNNLEMVDFQESKNSFSLYL